MIARLLPAVALAVALGGCAERAEEMKPRAGSACPEPTDAEWRTKYWGLATIDACPAWARVPDASKVTIAVVDSGIAPHPDLTTPQLPPGGNHCPAAIAHEDQDGHGTKVAGIIGARRSGTQAVGVAWSATLRSYKFLCPSGFVVGRAAGALEAATKASPPPDVVNASWAQFPQPSKPGEPHPDDDAAMATIDRAITTSPGVLFVFAAPPGRGPYPAFAARPNVLVVTASDREDRIPRWAGRDPSGVHLAAPGVAIATADAPKGGTRTFQGASAAAAFVSGCAGLVKAASGGKMAGAELARQLVDRADGNLPGLAGAVIGGRRLNCGRAVSTVPAR